MIAAYKGISWFSRLTRFANWSEYSHVSWVDPEHYEIEAWSSGVRRLPLAYSAHTPGTVVELYDTHLTQGELDGIREFLSRQVGKPYDWRGAMHFVTRRPERAADQDRWFCSELVFAAFAAVRRNLLLRIPAWKVSPAMVVYSPLLDRIGTRTVPGAEKRSKRPCTASGVRPIQTPRFVLKAHCRPNAARPRRSGPPTLPATRITGPESKG